MARLLLRTEYRSACARSRSSRSPAGGQRCGGAGMRRCRLQGAAVPGAERCRGAERCGGAEILRRAEAGQCSRGAARRAIFRGGGERRLGEHARQLVVLLLRRLQAARRLERPLPAWAKGRWHRLWRRGAQAPPGQRRLSALVARPLPMGAELPGAPCGEAQEKNRWTLAMLRCSSASSSIWLLGARASRRLSGGTAAAPG